MAKEKSKMKDSFQQKSEKGVNFRMEDVIFDAMFVIVPIIIACAFVFMIALIFSPKLKGKMMSRQMKAAKYMLDESKEDLKKIGDISIETRKSILDNNEDALREMVTKQADIAKKGIEITTRAIKDGFSKNVVYCKHCGAAIDEDSKFCKKCGKEQ